jgi:hypothetical protein
MRRLFRRLVNARLMRRLRLADARAAALERQAAADAARIDVLTGHVRLLEEVVARERQRVSAETQLLAQTEANARKAAR